jgi:uncharacterized NAD(P)/FAD-binding protein YdhS
MSNNKIELLRSACELVENSEKVLAMAFQHRTKFQAQAEAEASTEKSEVKTHNQVWWDMLIHRMTRTIQKKSAEIIELYEDLDGEFKKEQSVFAGHIRANSDGQDYQDSDVWDNFYTKLNDIDVSNLYANHL